MRLEPPNCRPVVSLPLLRNRQLLKFAKAWTCALVEDVAG
jgi:hypothetical protein